MGVTLRSGRWVVVLALLAVLAGCGRDEEVPRTPAEKAARAQALIEDGNEAYTQGDYRRAAHRYAAAAAVKKDDPAAHYGMAMALQKLGRDEEARAAYARSRELTQKR
jgi:Tfp pilus assembly protein PilF